MKMKRNLMIITRYWIHPINNDFLSCFFSFNIFLSNFLQSLFSRIATTSYCERAQDKRVSVLFSLKNALCSMFLYFFNEVEDLEFIYLICVLQLFFFSISGDGLSKFG